MSLFGIIKNELHCYAYICHSAILKLFIFLGLKIDVEKNHQFLNTISGGSGPDRIIQIATHMPGNVFLSNY